MPKTNFMGIDPGIHGSVVIIDRRGQLRSSLILNTTTEQALWDFMVSCAPIVRRCYIEKVGGYAGGRFASGSSMFNFGDGFGMLKMALTASGISRKTVRPQEWQTYLDIEPRKKGVKKIMLAKRGRNKGKPMNKEVGGETKEQFKKRLQANAQRLFPAVKVTPALADSLLLAYYCKEIHS